MSQGADPRPTEKQDQGEKSGEPGQPSQQGEKKESPDAAAAADAQSPANTAKKNDEADSTTAHTAPSPSPKTSEPKPRKSAAPIPILSSPPKEPLGRDESKKTEKSTKAPVTQGAEKKEQATEKTAPVAPGTAKTPKSAPQATGVSGTTPARDEKPRGTEAPKTEAAPKKSAPSTASAAPAAPGATPPPSIPPRSHHTVKRSPEAAVKKPQASEPQKPQAPTAGSVASASTASAAAPSKNVPGVPTALPATKVPTSAQPTTQAVSKKSSEETPAGSVEPPAVKSSPSPASTTPPTVQDSPQRVPVQASVEKPTAPRFSSPASSASPAENDSSAPKKPENKTETVGAQAPSKPKKPEPTYSSLDDIENEDTPRTWPKALGIAAATLVVLAGVYVGAQWSYAGTVANGTTVAGVDIGGLGKEDATKKLTDVLAPRLTEPAELAAEDLRASFDPTEAGISLDAEATVEDLIGFSLSPQRLITHLSGGDVVEPVLTIDDAAFSEALDAAAVDLEEEPVNGTVSFSGGEAIASKAEDGRGIDVDQAKATVLSTIVTDTRPIELAVVTKAPEITQEITDQYFAQAQKMTVGPITVEVADSSVEIPVKDFTKTISVKAEKAALDFVFDGEKLAEEVLERTSGLLTEAEDAHFEFEGGKPVIVPGKAGTRIDSEQLSTTVKEAAAQPIGQRTAEVALVEAAPQDSVEALEKLGIKEKVATFSTPITNDYLRTENLKVAAKRITGYLVKPGEEFDLLEVIGPVTVANGYHAAGVVVNGVHTEGVGGGLSQVATTTYNAGFFAGMTDIAHRPHSYWFERYPAGRESTIFVGSIDMIWRNDSPHGVLMRSYVANGKLTVEAWSTETYKVETTTSSRSNVVPATMTTVTAPNCEPQPIGSPGFTVTVTRKVTEIESGEVVIDEANTWRYKPDNGVTCKKASSKDDD